MPPPIIEFATSLTQALSVDKNSSTIDHKSKAAKFMCIYT